MTFGMDTSYLLRLLTGHPRELAELALARYQEAVGRGDSFSVSDMVVTEAYYALQQITISCEKSFRRLPDAEVVS